MALADDDESVPGASLPSLVDDTLLLIATYLPACRDVLSLSIARGTQGLPEATWREAHKALLPCLHRKPRLPTHRSIAHSVTQPVGIATGPKTWRERFVGGARLLSPHASPTVVETILPYERDEEHLSGDLVKYTLACVREDGVVLIRRASRPLESARPSSKQKSLRPLETTQTGLLRRRRACEATTRRSGPRSISPTGPTRNATTTRRCSSSAIAPSSTQGLRRARRSAAPSSRSGVSSSRVAPRARYYKLLLLV